MRRPYERAAAVATIERTSAAATVQVDTLGWRILVLLLLMMMIC